MHVTKHGHESGHLCVALDLHVCLTIGGNWWRVTATMMKMMRGQPNRVRVHSCNTIHDNTVLSEKGQEHDILCL